MSNERLCGPDCPTPEMVHRDPEPDWIGDWPVMHGESDHQVPDSRHFNGVYMENSEAYCLCGHPVYCSCPGWYGGGGLSGMEIRRAEETP